MQWTRLEEQFKVLETVESLRAEICQPEDIVMEESAYVAKYGNPEVGVHKFRQRGGNLSSSSYALYSG